MCERDVELAALQAQVRELRRQMTFVSHWHNTLRSPWYKTVWWFLQGYRVRTLGTWYNAPWNKTAAKKYNGVLG
jgi:hypothetical protein